MADVNTGLGWYADGEWLSNSSGVIGTLGSSGGSGMVDTGLGWSAKADYLQTAPQTYLTIAWNGGSRSYSKASGGYAICVRLLRSDWSGLAIISTVEDNAKGLDTNNSTPRTTLNFSYKNLTWYAYYDVPMQGTPTNYTLSGSAATVEIYDDSGMNNTDILKYVIDVATAGFTATNTGLGWAARADYLKNQSGETLATPYAAAIYQYRTIVKARDGYTIAVMMDSLDYHGVITISTDADGAVEMLNNQESGLAGTFDYLGRTWYWSDAWMFETRLYTDVMNLNVPRYKIYGNYTNSAPSKIACLKRIIDTAGVASRSAITFSKSSNGYSVTCMCKWITSYGGDIYCSPVLISSQPNNTLYTRNGTSPSVNNTEHQYQGKTFYMRKAPLDVLDGTETITSDYPVVDLSGVEQTNDTIFAAIAYQSGLTVGYLPAGEDPYAGGGTSVPGGGTPDFTEVSESISQGSTFPISFQSTGLCRVYVPSITDLNDLANYLWTDQTFLDTIKNILINQFENFMEAVISLTMVPCQVPKGTAQPVKVMFLSTGLSFPPATQQFVEVDCGYVDITERYASALDYNPYTKVSLYLPFIGTVPLDTDEVMGHRVKCVYTIDIVSGACVAKIMVDYSDSSNGVLYQFSGHCSISMPLTAADFSSYYAAAMSGLKMAAGLAAAGAGAPGLGGALLGEPTAHPSSTTTTTRTTARNAATGRQILAGTESKETSHTPGQASFKELATRASVNTVGTVINSKFSVEHSGGFTGNTGFLGVQAPYVIITRPDMCNPDEYGAYNGRPSMMYLYLGNLSGFTQVQNIKLTGIPATNPELGEIAELLKTGVIL